ncbi:MAG: polysaccharide deacetylase family protein, partial [Variovorax sp.]
ETVPDVPNFSWVDYGMRCGLPRMIEAIAARGLKASTSINAGVIEAYPQAAEAMRAAGWEFIGHGMHQKALNHAGTEPEIINASLDKIEAFTGTRPRGWLGPGLRETHETPEHLKAAGIDYVFDWVVDDLPNWMRTANGPLLSLPYNLELNDSIVYAVEKHGGNEMLERVERTLALFVREAARRPRIMAIGLHPHLIGVPHRFASFERMLDAMMETPGTCFMQGHELADWYTAQVPPTSAP